MRIAIDARAISSHFPGIGRATLGLLQGLRTLAHDDLIVVVYRPQERALIEATGVATDRRFELLAADVDPLGARQQWLIPQLARAAQIDLWHAPYYFRPFWGLPPTVVTIFDTIGGQTGARAVTVRARLGRALHPRQIVWEIAMRLSLRTARAVITAAEAASHDLQLTYGLVRQRLHVIPLAPDPHFRPQPPEACAEVRQRYALPPNYALYLGSNKPHKNLVALVESWAQVLQTDRSSGMSLQRCLVIAGHEDPRYPEARDRVAALELGDTVRFLPNMPDADLPALVSDALCFVFPSLHEGFGLPVIEAMACGTPVLASNRTSLPEVVGDAGLLAEPTPAALAIGLRQLLDNPRLRKELRARGLQRASQFTWERTAAATLAVYHAAIDPMA